MTTQLSMNQYSAIRKTAICIVLSMFYFAMLAYPFGVTAEGYALHKAVIAGVIFFAISIPAWVVNLKREFFDPEAAITSPKHMKDASRIGELAMLKKWLTLEEVKQILFCQQGCQGKRFGEIAVKRNYLTPDQVENLLAMQPVSAA